MEVVKGYDAKEMKRMLPCEEMNRPRFVGGSNEAGRRRKDGHGLPGGRKTGKSSLLFRPWYVWVKRITDERLNMQFTVQLTKRGTTHTDHVHV